MSETVLFFPPVPTDSVSRSGRVHGPPQEPRISDDHMKHAPVNELIGRILRSKSPYRIFGVFEYDKGLTPEMVERRRKILMVKLHPDRCKLAGAKEAYTIVHNAAVEVLADIRVAEEIDPDAEKEFYHQAEGSDND